MHLLNFTGDKSAWPVYLTIGNIKKSVCHKSTADASILIGYIPESKLECFSKLRHQFAGHQLFNNCMQLLLDPLREAGKKGVDVVCADGFICHAYLILSAYVTDYPKQCFMACNNKRRCPCCVAKYKKLGKHVESVWRDSDAVLQVMAYATQGVNSEEFNDLGHWPVNPFWEGLPSCHIFLCFTPDLLHQLYKGIFKDHIISWVTQCVRGGEAEIDQQFCTMTWGTDLCHFKKGISLVAQ